MAMDLSIVQAESTIGTWLFQGQDVSSLTELCRIKNYPNLWGDSNQLETTDLRCKSQTFVDGVKQAGDSSDFTLNYNIDVYKAVKAKAGVQGVYELRFGTEDGDAGKFRWSGKHDISLDGKGVNEVREMILSVTKSSDIEDVTT